MKAVIYARVMPNNKQVPKSDNLQSQERRCREFARKIKASVVRVFTDEGAIDSVRYIRGLQNLLYFLGNQKEEVLVIVDHSARIGLTKEIRRKVVSDIEKAGGKLMAEQSSASKWIEIYGDEIIETLKEMRTDV